MLETHVMTEKPLILVTNDDGINAPGIRALIEVMNTLGTVYVVAPDSPQSGMGHAITLDSMLFAEKLENHDGPQTEFSCSGTPADCVKIAIRQLLPKKPDLCVSGINHGSNASINVIYSGTMSAAVEAGIEGIPSIGFSLLDYSWNANFEASKSFVKTIAQQVLTHGLPDGIVLNTNIPNKPKNTIKGIKICRQAKANWVEKFDKRKNPQGKEYYWLTGEFVNLDEGKDTDEWALENDYVAVVPIHFDLTAHQFITELQTWELNPENNKQ